MAQDGHHGNKDAAAGNGHGAAPNASVTNAPGSPCESTDKGTSWTPGPAEVVDAVHGEEGGSSGKGSAADAVMAADLTDGKVSKGKRKASATDRATMHIVCERERRARMKGMYDELRCLLPHVAENTDKTSVVDEAISFIKQLEGTVQNLERLKQERARARQGAAADLGAGSSSASPPPPPPVAPWETPSHILPIPKIWSWLPKKKRQQEQPGAIVAAPPMLTWSEPNVRVCVIGDEAHINVRAPRLRGVLPLVLSVLEKHHIDVLTAQIYACNAYQSIFTFFTRVKVEEIHQLDPEAPESKDIYQVAMTEIVGWLSNHQ